MSQNLWFQVLRKQLKHSFRNGSGTTPPQEFLGRETNASGVGSTTSHDYTWAFFDFLIESQQQQLPPREAQRNKYDWRQCNQGLRQPSLLLCSSSGFTESTTQATEVIHQSPPLA
jgi:hypothetical protein